MNKICLDNGLNIWINPMPNTHSVTVAMYIKAGSCYEEENYRGITHLIEHLHFRRNGKLSQQELYRKMESMGSTLRGVTYREFLMFSMKVHPAYIHPCREIFEELLQDQVWTKEDLLQEKQVVLRQIEEEKQYFSMDRIVRNVVFKNTNFAADIMGSTAQVASVSLDQVMSYYREIMNSSNMIFCITGCINEEDLKKVQERLGKQKLRSGQQNCFPKVPDSFFNRKKNVFINDHVGDDLAEVNISFDVDRNKVKLDELTILNCILGEGVGSLLQGKLREEKGWTSDITSSIEKYENLAVLHIRYTICLKWLRKSLAAIVNIVEDLKTSITPENLKTVLPFYRENMAFYEDDTEEMNFMLAWHTFILGDEFGPTKITETTASCQRLMDVAETIFTKENMCVVIVGDKKKISKKEIKKSMRI